MRRSRLRKKIINIRQSGGWNNTGASSVPSYESFKIPTPRGFPSKETPGNNTMDMSLTGRKRPASDAEHIQQESTSSGALLQPDSEGDFACQHSLDGGVSSGRPLPQTTTTGVKQIVVRLSGLRQSAATSGESVSVNHGEPVKDMGMGTESQQETHRAVWSNSTDCSENRQTNHYINCSHPDFQSSQHVSGKPTVRILHQALEIPEKREPKEEPAETQKDDRPGQPANGENSVCRNPGMNRRGVGLDTIYLLEARVVSLTQPIPAGCQTQTYAGAAPVQQDFPRTTTKLRVVAMHVGPPDSPPPVPFNEVSRGLFAIT